MEHYTTGELSKVAGVGVETVRYYERRGLLPAPPRTAAGHRRYDDESVRRVGFIRRAQALGFTLSEIQELLSLRVTPGTCSTVETQATKTISRIDERMRELRRMKRALGSLVESCRAGNDSGECPIIEALEAAQ